LQKAGLYEYKLYAILPNATPQQIAAVFLDNEYRVIWDDYVTSKKQFGFAEYVKRELKR